VEALLAHFKNKAALAKVLGIKPQAVHLACARGRVPTSWLPKLIKQGISISVLSSLPLSRNGSELISVMKNME